MQQTVVPFPSSSTAQTEEKDLSCNKHGIYLQTLLKTRYLTGPDILCNLVGLLLHFRQFAIAVTGDIEAMFIQIAGWKVNQDA